MDQIVPRLRRIAEDVQCDCHICDTAMTAADEIERLRSQISDMMPAFLTDVDQGLFLGSATEDHPEDDCEDCQWHKQSAVFASRIEGGEFGDEARKLWNERRG